MADAVIPKCARVGIDLVDDEMAIALATKIADALLTSWMRATAGP
jgi:hypothetical protein